MDASRWKKLALLFSFTYGVLFPLAWATNKYPDLDVDNIHLDGSVISTTNSNGDLSVTPNGTGKLIYSPGTASTVPYLDASKKIVSSAVTPTQLGYVDFTSSGQTQFNAKAPLASPTFTGTVTAPTLNVSGQNASTVPYLDASKNLVSSVVTPAQLSYVDFTSSGQTQLDAKAPLASPTFTGTVTAPTLNVSGQTASTVPYLDAGKNLVSSAVTPTQLGYVDFTSSGQTQINTKAPIASPTFTGTVTTPAFNLSGQTASTVPYLDASKNLISSAVTPTQLSYVDFTSSGQTQMDTKAPLASPTFTGTVTGTFSGNLTGNVTGNASTATALASNPTDCSAGNFANAIDASGNLTCGVNGSSLTTLNATNISSGTIDDARLPASILGKTAIGINDSGATSSLFVKSSAIGTPTATYKAIVSQTADILQILDSSGGAQLIFDSGGNLKFFHNVVTPEARFDIRPSVSLSSASTGSAVRYSAFIGNATALATGVGGGIAFGGPQTSSSDLTEYGYIWVTKNNATSGDVDTGMHFATRRNSDGKAMRVLDMDNAGNSVFAGTTTAVNYIASSTSTTTAAGTTTLTATSNQQQIFNNNSANQTVTMPAVSTLAIGTQYWITYNNNSSSGTLTIKSSGANTICVLSFGSSGTNSLTAVMTSLASSGTGATVWSCSLLLNGPTSGFAMISPTYGGTGVTSIPTTASATAFAAWDANTNIKSHGFIPGFTTTATAAGTTTLTVSSNQIQFFTGATTQTLKMPVASTLTNGQEWEVHNNSSGAVTVQSSGANTICTPTTGQIALLVMIDTAGGTGTASWDCKTW
jgi:hypothetical protein